MAWRRRGCQSFRSAVSFANVGAVGRPGLVKGLTVSNTPKRNQQPKTNPKLQNRNKHLDRSL